MAHVVMFVGDLMSKKVEKMLIVHFHVNFMCYNRGFMLISLISQTQRFIHILKPIKHFLFKIQSLWWHNVSQMADSKRDSFAKNIYRNCIYSNCLTNKYSHKVSLYIPCSHLWTLTYVGSPITVGEIIHLDISQHLKKVNRLIVISL